MFRILDCLTYDHDLALVMLAAAVCVFGTTSSIVVGAHAIRSGRRPLWLLLGAASLGSTVWSTHFLSMLAFKTTLPTTYQADLTAASFLLGTITMALGVLIAAKRLRSARRTLLGGAIVGIGVAVLHYVGMAALQIPGTLHYHADYVVASILASAIFGAVAFRVATYAQRHRLALPATGLLLVLMTVSLHFTGMGAVELRLDMSVPHGVRSLERTQLAIAVFIAACGVLLIGMIAAIVDQRIAAKLSEEAERFRTLANGAFEGLVMHRHGLVVDCNEAARRLLQLPTDTARCRVDDWLADTTLPEVERSLTESTESFEVTLVRTDGSRFPAEVGRRAIRLADGAEGELLAIRDLTARKESEARIEYLALHDALTDLPNRRLFAELSAKTLAHAQRTDERFALLALDLDGFKQINDVHGHHAGDELLRTVSARIRRLMRDADVFARLGGDEFAIMQSCAAQPAHAMSLVKRLLDALGSPLELPVGQVTISASIGVALYPDDGVTIEDLLRNADIAMYRAKADGKSTSRFFEAGMDAALQARRRLEAKLRQAVTDDALDVAYQPLVRSDSREPVGFEALVRWEDPELGRVSPVDFIPIAEDTGLIVKIGEQVLRRACTAAVGWSSPLRVAVNLSPVQFRRNGLIETVARILQETGLPGERLELEITESLLIDNRDEVLHTLEQLKALGVRIAMDDFGTGYSSLSYLQSFPFDKIKIDRAFVSNLEPDSQSASIVRAVASMGKSLEMRVVAEGVETSEQAVLLHQLHCDELQGYLIAKPMSAGDIEDFLAAHSMHRAGTLKAA